LNIASDIWCPYICDSKEQPGILVEVLREIAKVKKITIHFEIMPLSRSLILANKSEVDIVLAITESHALAYSLKQSKEYYGGWHNDFYISTKTKWSPDKLNDLDSFLNKGEILGIIKGYEYGEFIDKLKHKYSANIHQATGNSPLENNIKMLQKGRISALLDSRYNVEYEIKKNNVVDIIYAGSEGSFVPLFLGYSPTIDASVIDNIDDGFLIIRQKGILLKILDKYGVSDWQQPT
jgi:polar amino acid transport system substrate-binding protein